MVDHTPRQHWMSVLARADAQALRHLAAAAGLTPHVRLRGPEAGLVMVQGRAGGSGAAFNMGEMTVVRCTVRNAAGQTGHATVSGRSHEHAELAAAFDAALQEPDRRKSLIRQVVDPLAAQQAAARQEVAQRAAATRVQFFTMATMR